MYLERIYDPTVRADPRGYSSTKVASSVTSDVVLKEQRAISSGAKQPLGIGLNTASLYVASQPCEFRSTGADHENTLDPFATAGEEYPLGAAVFYDPDCQSRQEGVVFDKVSYKTPRRPKDFIRFYVHHAPAVDSDFRQKIIGEKDKSIKGIVKRMTAPREEFSETRILFSQFFHWPVGYLPSDREGKLENRFSILDRRNSAFHLKHPVHGKSHGAWVTTDHDDFGRGVECGGDPVDLIGKAADNAVCHPSPVLVQSRDPAETLP